MRVASNRRSAFAEPLQPLATPARPRLDAGPLLPVRRLQQKRLPPRTTAEPSYPVTRLWTLNARGKVEQRSVAPKFPQDTSPFLLCSSPRRVHRWSSPRTGSQPAECLAVSERPNSHLCPRLHSWAQAHSPAKLVLPPEPAWRRLVFFPLRRPRKRLTFRPLLRKWQWGTYCPSQFPALLQDRRAVPVVVRRLA